jgi:hypothetical protein
MLVPSVVVIVLMVVCSFRACESTSGCTPRTVTRSRVVAPRARRSDWPYVGKRCVVVTHRPPPAAPHAEQFFADTPRAVVEQLGRDGARHVYVDEADVIQPILGARRVDDLAGRRSVTRA